MKFKKETYTILENDQCTVAVEEDEVQESILHGNRQSTRVSIPREIVVAFVIFTLVLYTLFWVLAGILMDKWRRGT